MEHLLNYCLDFVHTGETTLRCAAQALPQVKNRQLKLLTGDVWPASENNSTKASRWTDTNKDCTEYKQSGLSHKEMCTMWWLSSWESADIILWSDIICSLLYYFVIKYLYILYYLYAMKCALIELTQHKTNVKTPCSFTKRYCSNTCNFSTANELLLLFKYIFFVVFAYIC